MECHVCQVRSSVGFCVECQGLLCETCGIPCDHCRALMCPLHVHETRGGRNLCINCYEERQARKAQQRAAKGHVEGGEATPAAVAEPVAAEVGEEALVLSARKAIAPWQWSVYIAAAGVVFVLLMLIFPGLRRVQLSATSYVPTPMVLLAFPLFAMLWGVVGLIRVEYFRDRPKCLIGIGLSVLTIILAVVAVRTDPAALAQAKSQTLQEKRDLMTPDQLDGWRKSVLDRFK